MRNPYYKLAVYVERFATFKDGKTAYENESLARAAAKAPGVYRISKVTESGRVDGAPFTIGNGVSPAPAARKRYSGLASRPLGGMPH